MVTNSITYLSQVDLIIVLKDGQISEVGGYSDLIDKQGAFSEFIANYQQEQDSDSEDSDECSSLSESRQKVDYTESHTKNNLAILFTIFLVMDVSNLTMLTCVFDYTFSGSPLKTYPRYSSESELMASDSSTTAGSTTPRFLHTISKLYYISTLINTV